MPMDYDDNEFSIHNVELAEEGSSSVSSVLRPYDYEDGGNLRFDSLVENEVFLGITGQEDNQWIEEYSRGTSSSAAESRRDNVWSEATASESVEMLLKSVGQGALVTESHSQPGSLATNMDPNLNQDDENNHAQEAMVTNKEEEGALVAEKLDVSDEPGSLSMYIDPGLKQDDENNHDQEAMVTNKEEEGALAVEKLDVSDEPGSLSMYIDPGLKQDDENNHDQKAMLTNKEEEGALAAEKLDVSDEPGSLSIYTDPDLKQDDENNHDQEARVSNNEEEGALATEELDVSDDPVNLAINMNLNLKQDDHINHAQEAMVTNKEAGVLATEELDVSDDPGKLTTNMDPTLEQDDGNICSHEAVGKNKHQDHFSGSNASFLCQKVNATFTKDSHEEAKVSGGELDSDVLDKKCDLSEEKVNSICDDENHKAKNIAIELSENKLQDLSTSKLECANLDVSEECNLKKCSSSNEAEFSTNNMDKSICSHTTVDTCTNSDENPSNVESLDKPSFVGGIPVDEDTKPAGSYNLLMTAAACAEVSHDCKCAITAFPEVNELNNDLMHEDLPPVAVEDDDKTKSENLASLKFNVCSPSKVFNVQSCYVEESEKPDSVSDPSEMGEGNNIIASGITNTCSSAELLAGNTDLVATSKAHSGNSSDKDQSPASELSGSVQQQVNDELQSSEQDGGTCTTHDVTLHEEENARFPLNMDIAVLDNQKSAELISSADGCNNHGSEADITIVAKPDIVKLSSGNAATGYIDAKSPLTLEGISSVHHDNEEKKEEGFVSDGTCENESLKVASSMVDCGSLYVVETAVSPDSAGEVLHGTSVENMNEIAEEANSDGLGGSSMPTAVDPIPSDSSAKVCDNVEARVGIQESISGHHINISIEQHASTDMVLTSECDDSHMKHEEDSSVSMAKLQSVSLLNRNNTELSQSTRVKPIEVAINENASLPKATKDVVLTLECDDSHMRHEEDSSVCMEKHQCVSLLNTNYTELSQSTRVKPSEAPIKENAAPPEATEDVVLTSKCNDSHMRHGEDSFVSKNKLQSVSPLSNTNDTEPSQCARVKPVEDAITENASLSEATEDVVLTSKCDDSYTRHEEGTSGCMDKLQSVSLLNTNNTELSQSTGVKLIEDAIKENATLPEATKDVALSSECDDSHIRHEEDISVSMDKLQSVSPLLNTNNTELSQSTRVKPSEGGVNENASLPEAAEDTLGKEQSISLNSDMKIDKSFTFAVGATAGVSETGKGLQSFPVSQACNLSMTMEVPCVDSSSSTLDPRKPSEAPVVTAQTPGSGTIHAGTKERKTRRKSVGKESARKGKETNAIQSEGAEKPSPLLVTPPPAAAAAAGHVIQFQELRPKDNVECSVTKPSPNSNLPDLNNATCIFYQPFTNNQQVQLRAQILVYGSLISGMAPEEPHMIAAFGHSDAEKKTWEAHWHACLERIHGQKSQANTPAMQQPRSDLKNIGHRSPDLGVKHGSTLSSSNKGTPPAVTPLLHVSSPLWNMSTPSCVGFQSRSVAFQQSFTPMPPTYQTPPNPLWLSQYPFLGQWGVASSPASATPHFSVLPITEAVKLTPVQVSGGGPHTYSTPLVDSTMLSSLSSDGKKASSDSKSKKRKKVAAAASSVPSKVLMSSPPIAHLVPRPGGNSHNRIPFLVENQTDSLTDPVVTSIFSTSVTVSTPPASKSSSPGRFLSVHDRPRLGDTKLGISEDALLKRVEEGNLQEADVSATKTWQPSSDSRGSKRAKVTTSPAVNQTPVLAPAQPAVTYLPQVLGSEISLHAQSRKIPVTAPALCTSFPTAVAMSTPVSITSDSSPNDRFLETIYPTTSTHGFPRTGYQSMENALAVEETLSKVKESKLQAENAALLAAAEVSKCHDVWSRLDGQHNSGVVADAEAKLMSSVAAAASVAKMASAAARLASNVAEQAKLMADEVFLSSKTENCDHLHPNLVNTVTPASTLKNVDKTTDNHPNSIISAAREAARRRIEAASAASKHAENLDAIVKAAEMAAEAVSQVGKIVAMHDSLALRKLAEAGPEGFWKTSQLACDQNQGGEVSGAHMNSNSGKKNVPDVFIEDIQTLKHGLAPPVHLAHKQMMMVIDNGSTTGNEKGARTSKVSSLSKAVGVSTETNIVSPHTYVVGHSIPQNTPSIWEEHNIKEGCLVEVYKEDGKYKGAWLAANVLTLKDEKALVCYTEIQSSDEGPEKVKEWVAFKVEGNEEVPRIRIAHPITTMRFEGARKRRRTAITDYAWSKGDRVDVWMQDCWREGVVMEPNKIDVTSLTVQFQAQGETSVVRSWHVRPTFIWKDRKWIEWKGGHASQGETPKEKRMKLGSPAAVNDKRKDKLPMNVAPGRHEEQGTLLPLLSAQERCFNVGKSTNKLTSNLRTIQKEKARVVFGVPKPGKKQKFMEMSTQYINDKSNKNNTTNGSFKFAKPPVARGSKNDATENQVTETKSRLKSRKPPVPVFRTMTSHDSGLTDVDSVENSLSLQNQTQVGPSSNRSRDPAKGAAPKKAFAFTSKPKSEHFNRGKLQVAPKIEVKDKADSQVNEPRRSNRRIQPTSRLLEGIQSSLTISKIPSVSNAGQRKVTSKGNTNHG